MTQKEFTKFLNQCQKASINDEIWWDGDSFLEINVGQTRQLIEILKEKGFIKDGVVVLPSKISIAIDGTWIRF